MRRAFPILLSLLVAGCRAGGSNTQTQGVGGETETLTGRAGTAAMEERYGGLFVFPEATDRMGAVARQIRQANPDSLPKRRNWQFQMLNTDQVNAFSLPGGQIYLTRGLYERRLGDNNDLLAAVVAHEMAHIERQDSLKPTAPTPEEALRREIETDQLAAEYLRTAGYPAQHLADLLRLIKDVQPEGWAEARVRALENRPETLVAGR